MTLSLADLPADRAIRVEGASAGALALSIEPLPADAPAIVTYSFRSTGPTRSPAEIVDAMLRDLEHAAIELYPAWLPDAEPIQSPAGAGTAAVRALALRLAAQSHNFGPFVADLAVRALRGEVPGPSALTASYAPEVRAAGLTRVIAASFGRQRAAVLVIVPDGLVVAEQRALAAACEWLAERGRAGVWLAGAAVAAADWMECVRLDLPAGCGEPDRADRADRADRVGWAGGDWAGGDPAGGRGGSSDRTGSDRAGSDRTGSDLDRPAVAYPPVAGRPHPASRAELALEAGLASCAWAAGRCWNRTMSLNALVNPVQPDLLWDDARCVVEIDGDDHLDRRKYARDRLRDVELQLAGYAVLRFTNDQVLADTEAVLAKLERFLAGRRLRSAEGYPRWQVTN